MSLKLRSIAVAALSAVAISTSALADSFAPTVVIEFPIQFNVGPAQSDALPVNAGEVGLAADPRAETDIQSVIPDVQFPDVRRVNR